MRLRPLLLAAAILSVTGFGYVLTSDELGRPERPEVLETVPKIFYPPLSRDAYRAEFTLCTGSIRANCVVDGDTFWFEGIKIRMAEIDAPEISQPQCAGERQAGIVARNRLLDMLNEGTFSLLAGWRDEDRFGRKLRIVVREEQSLGQRLMAEGLARSWDGPRHGWCD